MVSIIIPTYNRATLLLETLHSVMAQTFQNWECIIVDDGSTDNSIPLISDFIKNNPKFTLLQRPESKLKGANSCRNFGFKNSTGEFVYWFDSDDLIHPNFLEKAIENFNTVNDIDYTLFKFQTFNVRNNQKKILDQSNISPINNIYEDYILGKISIFMISVLWRRTVFKTSLFDEELQQFQDLNLYSKILFKHRKFSIINEVLVDVRRNNDSITTVSNQLKIHTKSYLKVHEEIIERTPNNQLILNSVIKKTLGILRYKMASRDYKESDKCLSFINNYKKRLPLNNRIKLFRISLFYTVFKTMKKGDTTFKNLLKL